MKNLNKIFLTIFFSIGFMTNQNLVCMEGPIEAWVPTEGSNEINHVTRTLETLALSNPDYFAKLPDEMIEACIYDQTFKVLDPDNKDLSISDALSNAYRLSRINRRFRDLLKPLITEINSFYTNIAIAINPSQTSYNERNLMLRNPYDLLQILDRNIARISPHFQILAQNLSSEIIFLYPSQDNNAITFFIIKHPGILKILLKRGLNPNTTFTSIFDETIKTRLIHIAAEKDRTGESTALLLKYGANPNIEDNENETPLELALSSLMNVYPSWKNIKIIKLLLEYGADPTKALYWSSHKLKELSDNPNSPPYEKDWYINELIPLLEKYSIIYKQNKACSCTCTIQ